MGQADYYAEGQWNFRCQECWKKGKSSEGYKRWDGYWVCWRCYEIRNPQDFARGVPDNQSVPWQTGNPPPVFVDGTVPAQTTAGNMMLGAYLMGSKPLG